MATFVGSPPALQTTSVPANTATQIFNTSATGFVAGTTLGTLVITNTSTATGTSGQAGVVPTVWIGLTSGVSATTGVPIPPGGSVTLSAPVKQGATTWNFYAITVANSGTATVEAGLASFPSVI